MLAIRVGDEVYVLSEASAAELVGRLPGPMLEGGEPLSGSLEAKLRGALHSQEPAELDPTDMAIVGATIESWATEIGVDAADVQQLREAIAKHLA